MIGKNIRLDYSISPHGVMVIDMWKWRDQHVEMDGEAGELNEVQKRSFLQLVIYGFVS